MFCILFLNSGALYYQKVYQYLFTLLLLQKAFIHWKKIKIADLY